MPATVIAVVLLAALLHAAWNLLVRGGSDRALDALLVAVSAGAVAAVAAALLPAPARASWPHLAASAALHALYFALLARAPGALPRRTVGFALANAAVIAAYTIVDGAGVRRAGHAVAYTAWVLALDAAPLVALAAALRGRAVAAHARRHWRRGVAGGCLTLAAYALVLWAMTRAPVAGVAALRETSVVFATALATWRLREPFGAGRIAAASLVALGVALLER